MFKYYLIVVVIMSLITLFAYMIDKSKAQRGKWRTKEKTLLGLSFLFGSIGGLIALYVVRHKNKHWYFVVINWLSFIIHVVLGYFLYIKYGF